MKREEQIDLAFQVGKYILGLIFVILFFTKAYERPMINWITTSVEVDEEAPEEEVTTLKAMTE